MTQSPTIRVVTYDGFRAGERPIGVILDGERHDVKEIEDRWIATGVDAQSEVLYGFLVRCFGGMRFRLVYGQESGWRGERLPGPAAVK